MSKLPIVAVVGRPNVGKSTLVNRLVRKKAAVVDEQAGVTRDRREFTADWNGRRFLVVDTGGWELQPEGDLSAGIREQAEIAVAGADVVVFVADATAPLSDDDIGVARILQRSGVPHVFVANKVDAEKGEADLGHLWRLGLGEPIAISALHGRNTGDFLDRLGELLPAGEGGEEREGEPPARLAIIGRPNVGKSTLLNKLAGENRVLVSEIPGTTRDPIDLVVELDGEPFEIVDTAGIKRRPKIKDDVDFFATVRAHDVIREADVVLLMIDGTEGATQQEQRLAEEIVQRGTGLVVLLNKWDVVDEEERLATEDSVGDRLAFVSWAPVLRISAKTGSRLHRLPKAVRAVLENRRQRIPTPELNRLLTEWQQAHPPPVRKGKRPRVIYATQPETEPPTIVLFVRGGDVGPDYLRFIENKLRSEFDFTGTPIRVVARTRRPRGRS
ncbi:MAG: ribosome biogenesis GTPase Der [Actinobacteria bacterium]|nr:MAG: ribosome biogenesis GTPase Der [Actinomycetota bacterium]